MMRRTSWWAALLAAAVLLLGMPLAPSAAEQAAAPPGIGRVLAGRIDLSDHTCAVLDDGSVRCWGEGDSGKLGSGNANDIGDEPGETPGGASAVDLGAGRTAIAIAAGSQHTCALLDEGSVRCWGDAGNGRLGYGDDQDDIGDEPGETPGGAGPVDLGAGRTATATVAGGSHTCALLDDATVRCWGFAGNGRLGYGDDQDDIGDEPGETPGGAGPVDLGAGRTATAITAGGAHTCALLDDASVRCWGAGGSGRLGYGSTDSIGDDPGETPGDAGPVDLGVGRTAAAISAGGAHTCALLDNGRVRCWGSGFSGELGYGNGDDIGDDIGETPGDVGPVDLGVGRTATAITAGNVHTCALLNSDEVRCWGGRQSGQARLRRHRDHRRNRNPGHSWARRPGRRAHRHRHHSGD